MMLRPRQALLVERSLAALAQHGNTLSVGPTGSGKTIMLSAVAGSLLAEPDAKACILAHRDELTGQNLSKFARVNPGVSTSVFDAKDKSWSGRATFAMVQTLSRDNHLAAIPILDLLVIDEAHHAASASYRRVIDRVLYKNSRAQIFGVTATPARSDGKGLREVFSNVADQITLGELIASGHLVPPRTFVIDVGAQEQLTRVRRTATDFDMTEVEAILNKTPITDAVIRHWREKAGDRKTIVFCSTVAHAECVRQAFQDAGVSAVIVYGELSDAERKTRLTEYESGSAQVVVNVAVLTEGYDFTPTSCVVLLRPSSHKSTLTQMIGRGLRTIDPAEHPGVIKTDCVVLDFGTATLMHGSLEQDVNLDGHQHHGEAPTKDCPSCEATVPLGCRECPLCGFVWENENTEEGDALADFVMTEIDLLKRSNFRVAAEARQGVAFAQVALQEQCQLTQQLVARGMATGIVDDLELVEVHVAQHVLAPLLQGGLQGAFEAQLELAPVDESGKRVVARLVDQPRGGHVDLFLHLAMHRLQMRGHVVDAALQHAQFRIAVLRDALVEMPLADAADGMGQGEDRPGDLATDAPGQVQARHQSGQQDGEAVQDRLALAPQGRAARDVEPHPAE